MASSHIQKLLINIASIIYGNFYKFSKCRLPNQKMEYFGYKEHFLYFCSL